MRRIESDTSDLSRKLDLTIFLISQFLQLLPTQPDGISFQSGGHSLDRIEDWTKYASKLISSTETFSLSGAVETSDPETIEQVEQARQFVHERWDDQENEYLKQLNELPSQSPLDSPDYRFIPFLCERAYRAFEAKDFTAARSSLKKILERSPKIYGPHFEWRDETLRMLVIACVRLGDWDEAEIHMCKQFKGREQTLEDLAMDLFLRGKRDDAAKICLGNTEGKRFAGREAVMELLAMSYLRDKQWNEAKRVFSELLYSEQPEENIRLQRLQTLAEVHLALKDYENAQKCCMSVLDERRKRLGEGHVLYYQSVELLVQIYEKTGRGDSDEAAFFKDQLATDSHSMHS